MSFAIDCGKLSFICKHNPAVLEGVFNTRKVIDSVNKIVNELNKYIDKFVDTKSIENYLAVISTTENLIYKMDTAIAFSDLAFEMLVDCGKEIFGKEFRILGIDNSRYNDHNLKGRLPDGWDHLKMRKKPQWHIALKRKVIDFFW